MFLLIDNFDKMVKNGLVDMLNSRWMPNFHLLFHDLTKLEIGCERGFLVHRAMTNLLEVHFVLLVGFFLKNSWFSMQRFPRKKMSKESSF